MSQVNPQKYNYQVCLHCESKDIKPVAMIDMEGSTGKIEPIRPTGYLCKSCKKYHRLFEVTYAYDYEEMKKDIECLTVFLESEGQNILPSRDSS